MVMGDLVLLETEINPVMTKLLEGGLEITAIHNHILRAIAGHLLHACRRPWRSREDGDRNSRRAFGQQDTVRAADHRRPAARHRSRHRAARPDHRRQGTANGGVYQFGVPRRDPVTENGMQVTRGPLGVANAINFQPTGGGKAAITGDFVVTGDEVNPLIRALRDERHRGDGDPQPHAG